MRQRILSMPAWGDRLPPGYGAIRILPRRRRATLMGALATAAAVLVMIGALALLVIAIGHTAA